MGASESIYEGDVERWDEEDVLYHVEMLGEDFIPIADRLSTYGGLDGETLLSFSNEDFEQLLSELDVNMMHKIRLRTELKQISPNFLTRDKRTHGLAIGTKIDARFDRGDVWYRGVVSSTHIDGTYRIMYNDGDEEDHVPSEFVRLSRHIKKKKNQDTSSQSDTSSVGSYLVSEEKRADSDEEDGDYGYDHDGEWQEEEIYGAENEVSYENGSDAGSIDDEEENMEEEGEGYEDDGGIDHTHEQDQNCVDNIGESSTYVNDVDRLLKECWIDAVMLDKVVRVCGGDTSSHVVRAGVQCIVQSGLSLTSARLLWGTALREAKEASYGDFSQVNQDLDLNDEEDDEDGNAGDADDESVEEEETDLVGPALISETGDAQNAFQESSVNDTRDEDTANEKWEIRLQEMEIRARIMERYRSYLVQKGKLGPDTPLSVIEGETKESMTRFGEQPVTSAIPPRESKSVKEYEIVLSDSEDGDEDLLIGDEATTVASMKVVHPIVQTTVADEIQETVAQVVHASTTDQQTHEEPVREVADLEMQNISKEDIAQDCINRQATPDPPMQPATSNSPIRNWRGPTPSPSKLMEGVDALVVDGCNHRAAGLYKRAYARGVPRFLNSGPLFVQNTPTHQLFLHRNSDRVWCVSEGELGLYGHHHELLATTEEDVPTKPDLLFKLYDDQSKSMEVNSSVVIVEVEANYNFASISPTKRSPSMSQAISSPKSDHASLVEELEDHFSAEKEAQENKVISMLPYSPYSTTSSFRSVYVDKSVESGRREGIIAHDFKQEVEVISMSAADRFVSLSGIKLEGIGAASSLVVELSVRGHVDDMNRPLSLTRNCGWVESQGWALPSVFVFGLSGWALAHSLGSTVKPRIDIAVYIVENSNFNLIGISKKSLDLRRRKLGLVEPRFQKPIVDAGGYKVGTFSGELIITTGVPEVARGSL